MAIVPCAWLRTAWVTPPGPWWAACLSFLATEISAVTIISVPATAYSENWEYAQFFIGSSLGAVGGIVLGLLDWQPRAPELDAEMAAMSA